MILFDSFKVYCNEERTRTFLGLQIKTGYDSLLKLVEVLDKCLAEFTLSPFYEVTIFMTDCFIIKINLCHSF